MVKRSSGLIETRKARKVAQCLKALDGRKRVRATLSVLPTELILAVAHYLPPSGYMSLSYSCRTIRNKMGASIAHVLGDKVPIGRHSDSTLSIETRNIRFLERLDLQIMLDHDREISSSKAASLYYSPSSKPALELLRKERRCPSNAGLLWICPHRIYDYKEATESRGIWGFHKCECFPFFQTGSRDGNFIFILQIMKMSHDAVPSYKEVREALRPLDAPVCPHLRLKDAYIGNSNYLDCRKIRWNEQWSNKCNFCRTKISSEIEPNFDGSKTLTVTIRRDLRGTSGCNDRAWVAQVAQPEDFEEYERAWQATHAECLRKVKSFSHA